MYNLLFSINNFSNQIVSTLEGTMGIGYPILFNGIGVISIVLQFLIFQMRDKKRIVTVGVFSDIGWLLYFALQGDLISGTANIIGIMSKNIVLLREKHKWAESKGWNIFFLLFACGFSLLTFKSIVDIFAVIACTSSVLAFFMEKENNIRKVALVSFCAFACNSISKLYVVALIADVTALISIITSLIRYGKEEKREKREEE
ncbi:MAG: YgjV family protein [Clostridia bacterium]|nr:YgjV family protein [Clostridia bacterium]